jgi:hypothetical protein
MLGEEEAPARGFEPLASVELGNDAASPLLLNPFIHYKIR